MFAELSPKAIFLGILTVVVVGILFSMVAPLYEFFLVGRIGTDGQSLDAILDELYWPVMAYIWVGVIAAFSLGSYVATLNSTSASKKEWIVTVSALLLIVWAIDLSSTSSNIVEPTVYSLFAFFGGTVGYKLAIRRRAASS